jgi:sugar phosphate isomerase/epimerase
MQVDLCWMTLAGVDVRQCLKQLRGRVPMVHVKDVTARPFKRSGHHQLAAGDDRGCRSARDGPP